MNTNTTTNTCTNTNTTSCASLLIMNRYTSQNTFKISTQCHVLNDQFEVVQTYPRMEGDSLAFFPQFDKVMVIDVNRASLLDKVNITSTVS